MSGTQFDIIKNSNDNRISNIAAYVEKHPQGNIFQYPEMFRFFNSIQGHESIYFVLKNEDKILASSLSVVVSGNSGIKKKLTQRIIFFGGPLVDETITDTEKVIEQLLKVIETFFGKNPIYIQFRLFAGEDKFSKAFTNSKYFSQKRYNTRISIINRQECFKQLSESKKRQIKKSLKQGAKIIQPVHIAQVKCFYKILEKLFKEKIKKPLYEFSFFENFYRNSLKGKLGVILLIEYENKIIGGIICPVTLNKCIYEWYICGLDKEYKSKGIYPSVLATWAAIEYALDNNIPCFDLMGAGKPGVPYGVRDFKLRFGGSKIEIYRYNKIINRPKYEIAELAYNLKRWLG